MSAVCLKLITILCLSCTVLSGPGGSGVVWRDFGGAITIQCRPCETDQEFLAVQKGLSEDNRILFIDGSSQKETFHKDFMGRIQSNGEFPNMDILIKNLTTEDTGPYWCVYKKFDVNSEQTISTKGTGSVLLVVTDTAKPCDSSTNYLLLVSVVISAAVLLGIFICFLIWLIKTKTLCTTKKPRHVPNNDVYEDMRGTIRR
ncbi:uncharacterized protein LOC125880052 [Epinephelus fuscoguttatus]|uniref:uncharacterized protein LOC125880052 n=1 Tax=Epinephelus fuscoguttatus TaxID=293821 RepID=UPI0020D160C5|nr:uncharacterized protein LOC125880052 [Epinephelus fuscoguttatus]